MYIYVIFKFFFIIKYITNIRIAVVDAVDDIAIPGEVV